MSSSNALTPIFSESFATPGLPRGWYTDTPAPKYPGGLWDCRPWDGVIVSFPHDGWGRLRVEVDVEELGPRSTAYCGTDSRTGLSLALGHDPAARHSASDGGLGLATAFARNDPQRTRATLAFEWTADAMFASIDGVEVLRAPNIRRSARAGSLHLGFGNCVVRRLAASGLPAGTTPAPLRPLNENFPLEVTVDFNDDLMACAWSAKTFDNLFAELKSWGTSRVSWIDLGRKEDAYFDFAPLGTAEHAKETMANVGDIFTAAVTHAHRHGIELVGILKPFDMAIQGISIPPYCEEAKSRRAIYRVGVASIWNTRMAAENQHLLMARKPAAWGPARQPVWTRIDLVKDDDAPAALKPDDISLIVSDDNDTFRDYVGPIQRREVVEEYPVYECTPSGPRPTKQTRRCRVIRLEGLMLREAFIALQVRGAGRSFANRLCDLVHVYGESGEETHLTYGLSPRREDYAARFMLAPGEADPAGVSRPPVGPKGGFEFNRYPGSPSAGLIHGAEPIKSALTLDRGQVSYLALARGKDRSPIAVMSPSFPETRALWMTWVRAMLDAGADGIDIRMGNHHAEFSWGEFGFEQPVRDEMLQRTGVDIWTTDDFDRDLWRRIRGEGWTQFMREASALTRARGKRFAAHIDGHYDAAPGLPGTMNMTFDWQTWLREGLLDYVTGKALWPAGSFSREVIELAHSLGVPVNYTPYCNNFFEKRQSANHLGESPEGCHVPVERMIAWGRATGYDGFNFYECASALRAKADGSVNFRGNAEPLREVMVKNFRR